MEFLDGFVSAQWRVLITSMLPIIELRGAIPVGVSLGLSPLESALIAFGGSLIPVPIILFSVRPVFVWLKKRKFFSFIANWLTERSLDKGGKIQKYGFWGLIIFVGIPLPGTGIWSGTLAAALLDMRFKLVLPAIIMGNLLAAIIIVLISHGVLFFL